MYDLIWYLTQRPPIEANVKLRQNALDQTKGVGKHDAREWRSLVIARLASLDMKSVAADVSSFLEHSQGAALLTRENLSRMLAVD